MNPSRRLYFLILGALLVVFAAWFGWMSFTRSRTQWIKAKVEQAMSASVQNLAPQWPRIELRSDLASDAYYGLNIHDPAQTFELYRHVLETLNQDVSVPPVKVTRITLQYEFGSSEDTLISQAKVEFPLVGGIEKEIVVQEAVQIPHYQTLN